MSSNEHCSIIESRFADCMVGPWIQNVLIFLSFKGREQSVVLVSERTMLAFPCCQLQSVSFDIVSHFLIATRHK